MTITTTNVKVIACTGIVCRAVMRAFERTTSCARLFACDHKLASVLFERRQKTARLALALAHVTVLSDTFR